LSFVGGLLGLFAGFSALSFIELIYWFPIRMTLKLINRRSTKVFPFHGNFEKIQRKFKFLFDYFENSSIHGVNYFADSKLFDK
jgi:hypothetical protein